MIRCVGSWAHRAIHISTKHIPILSRVSMVYACRGNQKWWADRSGLGINIAIKQNETKTTSEWCLWQNPRYKVAWPRYTAEKKKNLSWTTLYPLPSRECLYKVAWSGYTLEKTPIDVGWTRSRAENATKWPAPLKTSIDVGWATLYTSSPFHPFAIQSGVAPIDVVNDFDIDICLAVGFIRFRCFLGFPSMGSRTYSPTVWTGPVISTHNHVDVSIDVIKSTIDITTMFVYWVLHIIVPLFDTSIIVWMLRNSLYSNGKRSQISSKTHIDFYVFTWPGDFIQRWFVIL